MLGRFAAVVLAFGASALADDLARELPRIPPLEPAEASKSFRIHEGFRLEPIAVEPLVTDPVSACFDADGRLYVVEMRGYPYPEKVASGNVRRLEDRDEDGRFETSTIFVDGLSWPTSVVPFDDGVFIAVAPDILYAKDNDGDGKADVRKVVFTGFGTQNVQALLNGLLWGPDGWIYGVGGGNGGDIRNLTHPDRKPVSIRGRDFRFKADSSAFEAASGGGQFGHSFDDWGRRFTCNNSNNIRQIVLPAEAVERNPHYAPPAVLTDIAVEGGAGPVFRISRPEPWRIVRTRQRLADPEVAKRLAPTERHAFGFFTSATGVTIYRGTAFPPEYRGNAFIGDVGGNLVHRKLMRDDGSIRQAERADEGVEFLASTDNWFRPVNFANTPDGALLVLDMYRETIEHPASIPEPIKKHLDLTSGHDRGRLYQLVSDGFKHRTPPQLNQAGTTELVKHLADPDSWWRETAQRLLIERRDPTTPDLLRPVIADPATPLVLVHALWTLDALGALKADDLKPALGHDQPEVRAQGARLAGTLVGKGLDVEATFFALAADAEPMVRFEAALALGRVKDLPAATADLAAIAVLGLDDSWCRAAVLCSSAGRAAPLAALLLTRSREKDRPITAFLPWLGDLAEVVGAENRGEEVDRLLVALADPNDDPSVARAVLLGLGRGLARSGGSLRAALVGPRLASVARIFEAAEAAAPDPTVDARRRADAIRLIGLGRMEKAIALLPLLLEARQPATIQVEAIRALAGLADPKVAPLVLDRWKGFGPTLRREAAEALLARPERVAALLDAIEAKVVSPSDLEPARRQQLLAHRDPRLRARAEALIGRTARSDRAGVIASYRSALETPGDAARGREVFRKQCATCHKAEGQGHEIGPDLATVAHRTPEEMLIHVLDPNREVAPNFLNYTVATDDGLVLSGMIAEETANAVTLRRAEGANDVVPRSRIEAMASTDLSLMPEGLEKDIDAAAMADLLAFLRAIRPAASNRSP